MIRFPVHVVGYLRESLPLSTSLSHQIGMEIICSRFGINENHGQIRLQGLGQLVNFAHFYPDPWWKPANYRWYLKSPS